LPFCRRADPTLYSVAGPAPALVAPVGRPHCRAHSRSAAEAGLAPAVGSTDSAPPECETRSARPRAPESRSETGKPSRSPRAHLHLADTGRTAVLPPLRRFARGLADDSAAPTSGRFCVPVSGVGLWVGAARRGPLVASWLAELLPTAHAAVGSRRSALASHARAAPSLRHYFPLPHARFTGIAAPAITFRAARIKALNNYRWSRGPPRYFTRTPTRTTPSR
jgi:hypothetical protein